MKIGILGTGVVGTTLATGFAKAGHEVKLGARTAGGGKVTFAEAAGFGEIVFNCVGGEHALAALKAAGAKNLDGKTLVDVANPLDFSKGMPPSLSIVNTDSLGEQLQRAFPNAKVVKALNTLNTSVMLNPGLLKGETDLLICGNDAGAKDQVRKLLESFGWKSIIDLGDITNARGTEMWLALWIRLMGALGTPQFNLKIVR